MVQTPGSTAPHTPRAFPRLIAITDAEKLEGLGTPPNQTSDEETVKVNPRPSTWAQEADERALAGRWLWCRVSSPPLPPPRAGFDLLFSVTRAYC